MSSPALQNFQQFVRRFLFGAVSCIIAVLCLAASGYLWHARQSLEHRHAERSEAGEAMLATVAAGPLLREELAAVHRATKRIEDNLVIENNLSENLWYFYTFEEKTKAHLSDLHQMTTPPVESESPYKLIAYSLRVTGTFTQVLEFLQNLEAGPRLLIIRSFNFSRAAAAEDTTGITLELTVDMLGKK